MNSAISYRKWKNMATTQAKAMERHCPIAYEEMRCTASVSPDLTEEQLMQLTIFPELEAFDHCPFRYSLIHFTFTLAYVC